MLIGNKVKLTEIRESDSEELYGWINDSSLVHYNSAWKPIFFKDHERWFESLGGDETRVYFAIRHKSDDDDLIIGVVQLLNIHNIHRSAELAIRIGREVDQGKGFGTDAVTLAVNFAWNDLNLQRVWLRVFSSNDRAVRTYLKVGFSIEGTLSRSAWINGCWEDEYLMAILRP